MEIVLSTRNKHKVREISQILKDFPIEVLSIDNFSDVPEVVEDGDTLKENAVKKARQIALHLGKWTLADDTGLEVKYLNGDPGVYSARFAGPGCSYEDNNRKLLGLLKGVERKKRGAMFKCVIALSNPRGKVWTVEGKISGIIIDKTKGRNGFGYDPVFFVPGQNKTFAQLDTKTKNRISHRGKATRKAKKLIKDLVF